MGIRSEKTSAVRLLATKMALMLSVSSMEMLLGLKLLELLSERTSGLTQLDYSSVK